MSKHTLFDDCCGQPGCMLWELNPLGTVLTTADGGRIVKANQAFYRCTGFSETEALGRSSEELNMWPRPDDREYFFRALESNQRLHDFPVSLRKKDGEILNCLCSATTIVASHRLFTLRSPADAARQFNSVLAEKDRRIDHLERKLDEMDTALDVLLKKLEREKADLRRRISAELQNTVLPHLEKIKREVGGADITAGLTTLEENLKRVARGKTVAAPFSRYEFTANEIQILELIKQGKRSKEIAALLSLSTATIAYHRNNIRKKLGLTNKKENLFVYLNAIQDIALD